jgi:hypothetical protein
MCSYKLVNASFEVWGMQTKVEDWIHRVGPSIQFQSNKINFPFLCQAIHDILLLGHRQAFVWMDDWHGMTLEDVREYEKQIQEETNAKVCIPSARG